MDSYIHFITLHYIALHWISYMLTLYSYSWQFYIKDNASFIEAPHHNISRWCSILSVDAFPSLSSINLQTVVPPQMYVPWLSTYSTSLSSFLRCSQMFLGRLLVVCHRVCSLVAQLTTPSDCGTLRAGRKLEFIFRTSSAVWVWHRYLCDLTPCKRKCWHFVSVYPPPCHCCAGSREYNLHRWKHCCVVGSRVYGKCKCR